MKHNDKALYEHENHETGTPFSPFNSTERTAIARGRVMPSPFSYFALPIGCTFIRNLDIDDDTLSI